MGITMAMGWNPCITAVLDNYWKQYVILEKSLSSKIKTNFFSMYFQLIAAIPSDLKKESPDDWYSWTWATEYNQGSWNLFLKSLGNLTGLKTYFKLKFED